MWRWCKAKSISHYNNTKWRLSVHEHRRPASYQLFTCKRVRLVCAAICLFSSSVGYGCWKNKGIIQKLHSLSILFMQHPPSLNLTMRCWKSQERMMLVACLGRTPLLFLDFLSSLSNRDDKSTFTLRTNPRMWVKRRRGEGKEEKMLRLSYCCHGNNGRLPITNPFSSVARAETPPQVSPW